jgi:hypothetical protein
MSLPPNRGAVLAALAAGVIVSFTAAAQTGIEYASVAEARRALPEKPGVTSKTEDGWFIVEEPGSVIWSFPPLDHEAHPSVAKRTLEQDRGSFYVKTEIKCEAAMAACDRLLELYKLLDVRMNEAIRRGR